MLLRILPAAATLTVLLAACSSAPPSAPDAQGATVALAPPETTVAAGGRVAFTATVAGAADTGTDFSVVEQGGGTITSAGAYTAPATTGVFHVRASAHADPAVYADAVVNVRPAVTVAVTPATTSVVAGGTVRFTATVANASNTAVTWTVAGSSCGTITQAGVYTAPAAPATCSVSATSVADPAARAAATVTVTAPAPAPVAVAIAAPAGPTYACTTSRFTASVTGSADQAVTWSVQEGPAGGSVSADGVYTAPATAGTYHLVATSHADPARSATATVTVTTHVVSMSVTPQTTTVAPGQAVQFTATVTTSCGTFTSSQTLTATTGG